VNAPAPSSRSLKPFVVALALAALPLAAAGLRAQPEGPAALDLRTAIGIALQHNFTIRQARERIRQQEGVEITVRARRIPNVGATGSYTGNAGAISSYGPPDEDRAWSVSLQARQVLYAGGGVNAAVRGSALAREAAVLELQGVINTQLLAVRTQFYTVLLDRERIRVQEDSVRLLAEQLKDAQNRFAAGTTSNFEVLRAEVALANGQPPLIQARNDYRVAIERLRQLLGLGTAVAGPAAGREPEIEGALAAGAPVTLQLADALAAARAARPELQQLARLERAGEQNVTASRAPYLPEFDLVAGYTWVRGPLSAGWDDRHDGWTAGVQTNWSLFDGRATAGRVVQAKSQLEQARLTLADTTLAVEVQVRQAYSSLVEAWELVQASSKTVEQAQEALRLANVRYGAGTATQLDVLTSQVALTEARLNQLQAYYGYSVTQAAMRQAMGRPDEAVAP
jgi:outer membrane protein